MGEVIGTSSALGTGFSIISGVVSLLAIGMYALLQPGSENNNDDDDSGPGGGLMQPAG
ncbi:MAG: hypothetical protein O2839_01465 [Cyanobacteria bacterium]|jgi:hypothetical protein|nr:hypothetical protein [Cyanobacteriota bacterium]